ncbi:MAG: peptide chain release factor N(5)-glutamine methyltransferase [Synergistaceae bacterium]|nr:peptide chain release factor N(5)-glutamine methyltransferase [Synergistaceae bacterium]
MDDWRLPRGGLEGASEGAQRLNELRPPELERLQKKISAAQMRKALAENLRAAGIENGDQEADVVLTRLLNCTRASVLAHPERPLSDEQRSAAEEILRRRAMGEPLQYILGEAHFWGRPFEIGPGVLIPRPETELLAELALERLPPGALFMDWGTGSGCIAITLLLERPDTRALMAEKNPLSLLTAWRNLARYRVGARALLWHSRGPEDIPAAERMDLVVSNPPYIPTKEIDGLMREVRHEPRLALDGGEDGLDCFRLLFRRAPRWLKSGGALLLEIGGASQAEALRKMAPRTLVLAEELADYAQIPRCVVYTRL